MIMPAQEPKIGHAGGDPLAQRAGQVEVSASFQIVVDLPPG